MKNRTRALGLLALTALLVPLAHSANAALPKGEHTQVLPCPNGAPGVARVWAKDRAMKPPKGQTGNWRKVTKFAVDNPCDGWLAFDWGSYESGDADHRLAVAPGVRFHWSSKRTEMYHIYSVPRADWLFRAPGCGGGPTSLQVVYSYNDVRTDPKGC